MPFSIHMGWRCVLFENWPVAPDILQPHIPDGVELDTYNDQAWLSVVPFTNIDVRPTFIPSGFGYRLPEINLRTYVTHNAHSGVYFFSLDAHGILSVLGARVFHHLPYYYAHITLENTAGEIHVTSQRKHPGARPAQYHAHYHSTGDQFLAETDSLPEFLTERHYYYTETHTGDLRYAHVTHDPWPLYHATVTTHENTLLLASGFSHPTTEPYHLYSPGVDTVVSRNKSL